VGQVGVFEVVGATLARWICVASVQIAESLTMEDSVISDHCLQKDPSQQVMSLELRGY
jgi:hypothetical protein